MGLGVSSGNSGGDDWVVNEGDRMGRVWDRMGRVLMGSSSDGIGWDALWGALLEYATGLTWGSADG